MNSLLKLDNVSVHTDIKPILSNISLNLEKKKITTLIGPNGAGKSTLVKTVLGLQAPTTGKRWVKNNIQIGYMPQRILISGTMPMTVIRFLKLACKNDHTAHRALQRVGIDQLATTPIQKVSGGEMQRVLLARALLRNPHLLVLDEPVQGVDINGQKELYELIAQIRDENDCGVLMVSHDLHLVMAETDEVVCLNHHICCSGHPESVIQHPAYLKLFGHGMDGLALYSHHHDHKHTLDGKIVDRGSSLPHQLHKNS